MAQTLASPLEARTASARALARPEAVGAIAATAVAALYWIGSGRPYGYDAAISVHRFIATGSLLDPLRKQLDYNNHVLFSFLDHVVYTVTGSADERVLRVLPVVAIAVAIGLLAAETTRRLGWLGGVAAAAVFAASPVLSANARDARGYGMLLLACVASTILLFRLRDGRPRRGTAVAYVLALAAGIATHLFGLAMLPLHAAVVGRAEAQSRRWLTRWAAATVLGLLPYAATASDTVRIHKFSVAGVAGVLAAAAAVAVLARWRPRLRAPSRRLAVLAGALLLAASLAAILTGGSGFAVGSPVQVATGLLGGYRLVAAALLLPAAAGLVLVMREHVWARYAAALAAAAVVLVWLAAPAYLAPRFFIWLLPAVAFGVAVAVTRWRVLAIVVLAIVAAEVYKTAHDYTAPEVANLQAAQIARHVESAGGTACAFEPSARAIQVYDPAIKVVERLSSPGACDVLLAIAPWADRIPPSWVAALPHARRLPAHLPGVVRSRVGPAGATATVGRVG